MHLDHPVNQVLVLSDLFFKLTGKSAVDITAAGADEFPETINEYEFSILPPEQRVL